VATVAPGASLKYTVIVQVDPQYGDRTVVTFTADMTYDQNGFPGLTGSAQDAVDTGSLGDGELQLSTNTPGPPDWLMVRVHLGQAGKVTLRIYNSAGELVKKLVDEFGLDKQVILSKWDGKNDAGQTVAAGVYVIQANIPHTSKLVKFVVLH
jgi:hypothetical protein